MRSSSYHRLLFSRVRSHPHSEFLLLTSDMAVSPIRMGVIGLSVSGGWASLLLTPVLPPASLSSRYKLTAVCTTSAETAKATAEKYSTTLGHPVKAYHGAQGQQDIAQDPDVDMVLVVVKVGEHRQAVLPALGAGKSVFVEWPLGKNLSEAREIADLAAQKRVTGIIGNQVWQSPALQKVCLSSTCSLYVSVRLTFVSVQITQVVKAGELGKIVGSTVVGVFITPLF